MKSTHTDVSPFLRNQYGKDVFKPTAQAIKSYSTPIQQISASSTGNYKYNDFSWDSLTVFHSKKISGSFLAVRTLASTSLYGVDIHDPSPARLRLTDRAFIDSSSTGGRPVVDVRITSSPETGLLVNDQGAVYRCDFGGGWKSMLVISELHSSRR